MSKDVDVKARRAVVATVHLPGVSDIELESSLTELRELAKTLGYDVVRTFVQKRADFDATAYLGTGKRDEIRRFVQGEPLAGEDGEAPQRRRRPSAAAASAVPPPGQLATAWRPPGKRPRRRRFRPPPKPMSGAPTWC
jgi:hypothetical protein